MFLASSAACAFAQNLEQMIVLRAIQGICGGVLIPMAFTIIITLFAASNFMNIEMTAAYAADQFLWPNIVRAVSQALVFAPLSAVATAGIEKENAGTASALFNMMRDLGGAFGIAMLQTFLTKPEQFHSNVLMRSVSLFE